MSNATPSKNQTAILTSLSDLISSNEKEILSEWVRLQTTSQNFRRDLISEDTLRAQSGNFLQRFILALKNSTHAEIDANTWQDIKELLTDISASRAKLGFSPSETAMFVFSLKQPVFVRLHEISDKKVQSADGAWTFTVIVDQLGLYTTEMFQKSREHLIQRQQQEMLELSTPVVRLWDNVLALPLIGTLDSARTQVVMETLLQEIVTSGAAIAIIDITGVPTVDTLVAQHLLKTVAAARLMGADCIISGIRPQIAQTIVHLGVELNDVITKATLADAFSIALARLKYGIMPLAQSA